MHFPFDVAGGIAIGAMRLWNMAPPIERWSTGGFSLSHRAKGPLLIAVDALLPVGVLVADCVGWIYRAAVEGDVQPEEETWEDWLLKLPEESRTERVESSTPGARHALLRYRRLVASTDTTILEI